MATNQSDLRAPLLQDAQGAGPSLAQGQRDDPLPGGLVMPPSCFEDVVGKLQMPEPGSKGASPPRSSAQTADGTRFDYCLKEALQQITVRVVSEVACTGEEARAGEATARLRLTLALPQDSNGQDSNGTSFLSQRCLWVKSVIDLTKEKESSSCPWSYCPTALGEFMKTDTTVVVECSKTYMHLLKNCRVLNIRMLRIPDATWRRVDLGGDPCRAFPTWTLKSDPQQKLSETGTACEITLYPLPSASGSTQWMRLKSLVVDSPYLDLLHTTFTELCANNGQAPDFAEKPWMDALKILDAGITDFTIQGSDSRPETSLTTLCNLLLHETDAITQDSVLAVRALLLHGASATAAKHILASIGMKTGLKGHALELQALLRAHPDEPWCDLFETCKVSYSQDDEEEATALKHRVNAFEDECVKWASRLIISAVGALWLVAAIVFYKFSILSSTSSIVSSLIVWVGLVFIVPRYRRCLLHTTERPFTCKTSWCSKLTWISFTPNLQSGTPWRRLVPEVFVDESIRKVADDIEQKKESASRYANVEFQSFALIGCVGPALKWARWGAKVTWIFFFVFTFFAYFSIHYGSNCYDHACLMDLDFKDKMSFGKDVPRFVYVVGILSLFYLISVEYKVLTYVLVPVLQVSKGFRLPVLGPCPFGVWLLYQGVLSMLTKLDLVTCSIFVARVWTYGECYVERNVHCLMGIDATVLWLFPYPKFATLVTFFWIAMFLQGLYSLLWSLPVREFRWNSTFGPYIFRIFEWWRPNVDWFHFSRFTDAVLYPHKLEGVTADPLKSEENHAKDWKAFNDAKDVAKSSYYCTSKDCLRFETKQKDCSLQIHKDIWTVTSPEQTDPGKSHYIAAAVLIFVKLDEGSRKKLNVKSQPTKGFELQLRGLYNGKCVYFEYLQDWWVYFDNGEWKFGKIEIEDPIPTSLTSYAGPVFVPHVSPDSDSLVPPAGCWDGQSSGQFNGCSIEVIRKDNPDKPPKWWPKADWLNTDRLSCYVSSPPLQYQDATEDAVLLAHEGGTPEGRYHTLVDENEDSWSGYADSVLLLADFNRMASVVSMKTAYNRGKLEYFLSRRGYKREGPAFGVLKRVIKLTYHKTLLYGVAQSFFILNFQLMIYNMMRAIRGSADWFSLAMVFFGVSTYFKALLETFETAKWVSEFLERPANRDGFRDPSQQEEGFAGQTCWPCAAHGQTDHTQDLKRQLQQQTKYLYRSLAAYFVFGLILIWKVLQAVACPEHTVGGLSFAFASCLPVEECCRTTCCDQSLAFVCQDSNKELFTYMTQNITQKCFN